MAFIRFYRNSGTSVSPPHPCLSSAIGSYAFENGVCEFG